MTDQYIDPRQLQDFFAVAEYGSITAAADARFVGASSVSLSLTRLERRLGAKLFERGRGGTSLTGYGRSLLGPAAEALQALSRIEFGSDPALVAWPRITVATTASLAEHPTTALLAALHAELPNLRSSIIDPLGSSVADAIDPVVSGDADVAITEVPTASLPGMEVVRLPDDELRLVCPPGTPAPTNGVFCGDDLMRIGLVVAPRFETSDVYRHLRAIAPRIDQAFVMRSQHRDAFGDYAQAGIGAVILERSSARRAAENGCVTGEIDALPARKIAAVARPGTKPRIVDRFLARCARNGDIST